MSRKKRLRRWWRRKFRKPYSAGHIPGYGAGGSMHSYVSSSSSSFLGKATSSSIQRKKIKTPRLDGFTIGNLLSGFKLSNFLSGFLGTLIKIILSILLLIVVIGGVRFKFAIFDKMPEVSSIENADFSQTTEITDRHGEVLYKLFDQNREYVPYEAISPTFINALIATEDQTFWTNSGIAFKGISRAVLGQLGIIDFDGGGSTLTQQLLKNLLFTASDSVYKRKVMELFLAGDLNDYLEDEVREDFPDLDNKGVQRKVKEKIIELYANYIFLGNNTYGVEIASQTYFAKKARDMNILEGAILAGIPQAPSRYDPYTDRAVLMGEISITKKDEIDAVEIDDELKNSIQDKTIDYITKSDLESRRNGDGLLAFVTGLLSFNHTYGGNTYVVNYELGRKDFVLARLVEDQYITPEEFKDAFIQGFTYEFGRKNISIKAPHFVFRVMSRLEEEYGEEYLRTGGLTVQTSLDREIQQMAEQSIEENISHLASSNADNSAMVYIESHSGDVVAYVGSKNYNDDEIDGQVDMVQANRQPGSIIKPLLYTQGFRDLPMTLDSPIYDIGLTIGGNEPENSDGEFRGLTTLKQALAGSRNIPAIKMFINIGGEASFKSFLYSLGVRSLNMDLDNHGYALSLGAAEIPMIEMSNAYMHLSAQGKPAEINPILKITKDDDSVLYEKKVVMQDEEVPAGVAYLLRDILSNKENFPSGWRSNFTAPGGLQFATKSGTSNVVKGEEKFPRDGRLATYNGSHVLMHWTGNTDGSAMNESAYGGRLNSPIRKSFLGKLNTSREIADSGLEEKDVKSVSISKLTGQLSTNSTPLVFIKKSLGYIDSLPTEYLAGGYSIYIDSQCGGKVSDLTPPGDRLGAVVVRPTTMMPRNYDQKDIDTRWRNGGLSIYGSSAGVRLLLSEPSNVCETRAAIAKEGDIKTQILSPTSGQTVTRNFSVSHLTTSPFPITRVRILLGDIELKSVSYDGREEIRDITSVSIGEAFTDEEYVLKVVATDDEGFGSTATLPIKIGGNDLDPPYFVSDKVSIKKQADGGYEVILLFGDASSSVVGGSISFDGGSIHTFNNAAAQFVTPNAGLVTYTVKDSSDNILKGSIQVGLNDPDPVVEEPDLIPEVPLEPTEPDPVDESDPTVEEPIAEIDPVVPPAVEVETEPETVPEPVPQPESEPEEPTEGQEESDGIDKARIEDMMNGLFDE